MDNSSKTNNLQSRPKVLVLGNGILRAFGNGVGCKDFENLIYEVSKVTLPDGINRQTIPFPMRIAASFASSGDCHDRIKSAVRSLIYEHVKGTEVTNELFCNQEVIGLQFFKDLLNAGFTDIITTNYSYEIEKVLWGKCPDASTEKNGMYDSYIYPQKSGIKEWKFKICKYYRFPGIETRIWHVHGEYLRPQSIIFDYCDYCSLLAKVKNSREQKSVEQTEKCSLDENGNQESTWLKTFVWGDIYILGFSASLEEPLFWWAMARKNHNQFQKGKVYFYEPTFAFKGKNSRKRNQRQKDVLAMMAAFNADHCDLGLTISDDSGFQEFYHLACKDIITKVKGLKKSAGSSKKIVKRKDKRS